jgi:uncharacterized protein (TIRG00374 family)
MIPKPSKNRITTTLHYAALYTFTFCILYLLLKHVGIRAIADEVFKSNPVYLLFALLLSLFIVTLSAWKLKIFIHTMGYKINTARCLKLTLATYPLNLIIPSKGGDFAKSWALRDTMPFSQSIGVVILERLLDVIVLCLLTFLGSLWINKTELILFSSLMLAIALTVILILYKIDQSNIDIKFFRHVKELGHATRCLLNHKKDFTRISVISVMIWLGTVLQVSLLYVAFKQAVPFLYCIAAVPIAVFVGLLPITIAGMGTRDLSIIYLFSVYASESASISVGLFLSLLRYWVPGLIGLPFIKYLKGGKEYQSLQHPKPRF